MATLFSLLLAALPVTAPTAYNALNGNNGGIRYVDYQPDAVVVVAVQRGTATRIVLSTDERILRDSAATGYAADCGKSELAWCMRADAGGNQVLIRPKPGASSNNLELRTDKRDYSFRFEVLPDAQRPGMERTASKPKRSPDHRLIFRYPDAITTPQAAAVAAPRAADLIRAARPTPRNWQYSMQVLPGGDDITPALVFDDGRFTYLQFPANRELPTVYYVAATGEEGRVNFHIDQHDAGLLVVERVARRFVLRLGDAVVGIWNDDFDSYGVAPADGTTVDGVRRQIKEGQP
jgi:type IV secretion system protein VirB9